MQAYSVKINGSFATRGRGQSARAVLFERLAEHLDAFGHPSPDVTLPRVPKGCAVAHVFGDDRSAAPSLTIEVLPAPSSRVAHAQTDTLRLTGTGEEVGALRDRVEELEAALGNLLENSLSGGDFRFALFGMGSTGLTDEQKEASDRLTAARERARAALATEDDSPEAEVAR